MGRGPSTTCAFWEGENETVYFSNINLTRKIRSSKKELGQRPLTSFRSRRWSSPTPASIRQTRDRALGAKRDRPFQCFKGGRSLVAFRVVLGRDVQRPRGPATTTEKRVSSRPTSGPPVFGSGDLGPSRRSERAPWAGVRGCGTSGKGGKAHHQHEA